MKYDSKVNIIRVLIWRLRSASEIEEFDAQGEAKGEAGGMQRKEEKRGKSKKKLDER